MTAKISAWVQQTLTQVLTSMGERVPVYSDIPKGKAPATLVLHQIASATPLGGATEYAGVDATVHIKAISPNSLVADDLAEQAIDALRHACDMAQGYEVDGVQVPAPGSVQVVSAPMRQQAVKTPNMPLHFEYDALISVKATR